MSVHEHLSSILSLSSTQESKNSTSSDHIDSICAALRNERVNAHPDGIDAALSAITSSMKENGVSNEEVVRHVYEDLEQGLAKGQSGPRYFGFVTGGALPAAQCGDILATCYDQNVQVHLPSDTISTALEHRTLEMVLDLLSIPRDAFPGRSLTTGATASNILGLTCGRDYAIRKAMHDPNYSVGDCGFPPRITIRVLTDRHHASIEKAAAVAGIGRKNVINLMANNDSTFAESLTKELEGYDKKKTAVIVVVSSAEVNTGDFTDMKGVREICDEYGAWLHIDAAFGALACLLPEYSHISAELAFADSITTDGHKWFNVPYSSGIFFCRDLKLQTSILAGSSLPAYLTSSAPTQLDPRLEWTKDIPSPLHTNLENSRRFTALPLYCALLNQGRDGYRDIITRNVQFARDLAGWMQDEEEGGKWYEVLNLRPIGDKKTVPLNVILFRSKDVEEVPTAYRRSNFAGTEANANLVKDLNATGEIYVSPGAYTGGAVRIAVSNWMTGWKDEGEDLRRTKVALASVMDRRSLL